MGELAIRDNLVKRKPLRSSFEAVCMRASLSFSIYLVFKDKLDVSHAGICGENVFEIEMAGCWLVGISV